MHRTMSFAALSALVVLAAINNNAQAAPYALQIDPSQSTLNLFVTTLLGIRTGDVNTNFTSGLPVAGGPATTGAAGDVQDGAPSFAPGTLTDNGNGFNLVNASMTIPLEFLGSLSVGATGIGGTISLSGPLNGINPIGGDPGSNEYDLTGQSLTLNAGSLTYGGSGLIASQISPGGIDFGADSESFAFAPGAKALVNLGSPQPFNSAMTLTVPVSLSTSIITLPIQIDAILTGTLVFTGLRVAEPGTFVLLAMGMVGMVPVVRRRMQRQA